MPPEVLASPTDAVANPRRLGPPFGLLEQFLDVAHPVGPLAESFAGDGSAGSAAKALGHPIESQLGPTLAASPAGRTPATIPALGLAVARLPLLTLPLLSLLSLLTLSLLSLLTLPLLSLLSLLTTLALLSLLSPWVSVSLLILLSLSLLTLLTLLPLLPLSLLGLLALLSALTFLAALALSTPLLTLLTSPIALLLIPRSLRFTIGIAGSLAFVRLTGLSICLSRRSHPA
jgi:hypothetical protein